jgi:radical SAM protein
MTRVIPNLGPAGHPVAEDSDMAQMPAFNFDRAPFLVIWEVTRACALACVHCRADAIPRRDPRELTTDEGFQLIDQIHAFGTPCPLLVLTGGDPMRRPDLAELVRYARTKTMIVALTPSGTAAATRARLRELKDAGVSRIAVSLDGPDAATHDRFRGVRGSYDWTTKILAAAQELDLSLQINTTVSSMTFPQFEAMARRVREFPIALWAVFFLVRTGRGASLDQVTAEQCEDILNYLYDLSLSAPFGIKTTEAPHYHRVIWQRNQGSRFRVPEFLVPEFRVRLPETIGTGPQIGPGTGPEPGIGTGSGTARLRAPRSVNDGNGFVFIDHTGNVYPSGFLPVRCGNVRTDDLVSVYQNDEIFRKLRDPDQLTGKCGRCEFRAICGGSRARAYVGTGSLVAPDPLCAYDPGPDMRPMLPISVQ